MKPSSSCPPPSPLFNPKAKYSSHGDHGIPFLGEWKTPIENPHNEAYQIPMMIYNPRIRNPANRTIHGNFYSLSIPTTILDLMVHTNSIAQSAQRDLARRFASHYEFAQSLLRPVKETIRMFFVHPGGTRWVLDNGRNLRVFRPQTPCFFTAFAVRVLRCGSVCLI
jgi:arylsulfatase A-like enzyme